MVFFGFHYKGFSRQVLQQSGNQKETLDSSLVKSYRGWV